MGSVIIHEKTMFLTTWKLRVAIPRATPTPMIDPTRVWVVDTGSPNREQARTVVAVPNSAEKPRDGVSSVIFFPVVSITL